MTARRSRLMPFLAFVTATLLLAALVGWTGYRAGLAQLQERGQADLALAADRLQSQLQGFRDLAVLMADHPVLVPMGLDGRSNPAADRLLTEAADKTGAAEIWLVAADGRVIAGSDGRRPNIAGQAHFRRAMDGALGRARIVGPPRQYVFAAPIFTPGGAARAAVTVAVDLDDLEGNWPADPSPVFFSDDTGQVFMANRAELVGRPRLGAGFPPVTERKVAGYQIWSSPARLFPDRALHLTQGMPLIGLTAEILTDTAPVEQLALWQAAVAAALCLVFGALLYVAAERRRALADRLRIEEAAKADLETRVIARTAELSAANESLRREVVERQEAEARLKKAQADLVQAGKLSALGQMSAGISHELNQPLMAIQSFAENARAFLERDATDRASDNLGKISELARRMGRIIKNLRAFARQETEQIRAVDLVAVVEAVLELTETRAATAGVTVNWHPPPGGPVWVRGGEVRLQQVAMNLVSNAIDAMATASPRALTIAIRPGDPVQLSVADTGPGISEPDRIFDPFYSTKSVGQDEGMGLGLSISYGLVQSFGGAIRGANRPQGGAVFTVELQPARREAAA